MQDNRNPESKIEHDVENLKGIRIRSFNQWMTVIVIVLYVIVIFETRKVTIEHREFTESTNEYISCEKDAVELAEGSDILTEKVRLFVITGNPKYAAEYFEEANVARSRDHALEELKGHLRETSLEIFMKSALQRSNKLMEREIDAMKLAQEGYGISSSELPEDLREAKMPEVGEGLSADEKLELARQYVFDEVYESAKSQIDSNVRDFVEGILKDASAKQYNSSENLRKSVARQRVLISLLLVINVISFMMIAILVIRPLNIYVRRIRENRLFEILGAYEFKYLALTYNNIHEINAFNEALLQHQAEHDALTGIMNRSGFDRMTAILSKSKATMALLVIDVDHFKDVNDTYGHEVGDEALKRVAEILVQNFRNSDTPIRYGGDEFVVLMASVTEKQTDSIISKIKEINEILQSPQEGFPKLSISVGVAFSTNGYSQELFCQADEALYEMKEAGRCGCRFYQKKEQ